MQNAQDHVRDLASIPGDLIRSEEDFSNAYPGAWIFKRENGQLNFISGGNIPSLANNKESVKDFIIKIAPLLGVPEAQIKPEVIEASRSALSVMFLLEQRSEGYRVYQGNISVQARNADGGIFLINNQMKPVGSFSKSPKLTPKDAQTIIETKYFNEIDKIALLNGPVIFAKAKDKTELAWVFNVTFNSPQFQANEIVIGADSGLELHQQSLGTH